MLHALRHHLAQGRDLVPPGERFRDRPGPAKSVNSVGHF